MSARKVSVNATMSRRPETSGHCMSQRVEHVFTCPMFSMVITEDGMERYLTRDESGALLGGWIIKHDWSNK